MKAENVKVGMKVVPHKYPIKDFLTHSGGYYGNALKNDGYLIVRGSYGSNDFQLWPKDNMSKYASGFAASDFEPYIEPAKFPITPKRKFRGYIQGNEVVVHFEGKTGKANYNPEDEKLGLPFSINKGVDIALRRTLGENVQDIEIAVNPQPKTQDKPTFEVGETVKFRDDLVVNRKYDRITYLDEMKNKLPKIFALPKPDSIGNYHLNGWCFTLCMLEKVPQPAKFVPHLKDCRGSYGVLGDSTPFKDVVSRDLFVGDTIELFKNGKYQSENVVIQDLHDDSYCFKKYFILGIECACKKDGTIDDWQVIKKHSYSDIPNGEIIDGVKYIREELK